MEAKAALNVQHGPPAKHQRIESCNPSEIEQPISLVHQNLLDKYILEYFIDEIVPLTTVEKSSFRKLVLLGRSSKLKVMCRKTLVKKLEKSFDLTKKNVIDVLSKQNHVSSTADLWTKARKYDFFY